jgi:hypothetical protein
LFAGWAGLFAFTAIVERPLIRLFSRWLGAPWVPTVRLALVCAGLCAVGWLIGHWGDLGAILFAATLAIYNFGLTPGLDIPWLIHLLLDCFHNLRYLEAFATSLATHVFLFGSLFYGVHLTRAHRATALHIYNKFL